MNTQDTDKPVTLGTLLEFTDEVLLPRFSDLIDKKLGECLKDYATKSELGELIDRKLEEKFEAFEKRLENKFVTKAYLDDKLADLAVEIIDRLERRVDRERKFKFKLVEMFRKDRPASPEDVTELEQLIQ